MSSDNAPFEKACDRLSPAPCSHSTMYRTRAPHYAQLVLAPSSADETAAVTVDTKFHNADRGSRKTYYTFPKARTGVFQSSNLRTPSAKMDGQGTGYSFIVMSDEIPVDDSTGRPAVGRHDVENAEISSFRHSDGLISTHNGPVTLTVRGHAEHHGLKIMAVCDDFHRRTPRAEHTAGTEPHAVPEDLTVCSTAFVPVYRTRVLDGQTTTYLGMMDDTVEIGHGVWQGGPSLRGWDAANQPGTWRLQGLLKLSKVPASVGPAVEASKLSAPAPRSSGLGAIAANELDEDDGQ